MTAAAAPATVDPAAATTTTIGAPVPSATSANPMPTQPPKTVFLIRHAESLENERLACLSRSFSRLTKFSLPNSSDLRRSAELLNVPAQVDSAVSSKGRDQINQLAGKLAEDDFLNSRNVELVVHSPLERARQTCEGMLGCVDLPSTQFDAKLVPPVKRVVESELLLEKTPAEWLPGNYGGFADRITRFEDWVCEQPEDVLAVVGHSQFFKAMLGLEYKFGNCEVWEVTLACDGGGVDDDCGVVEVEEEKKDDHPPTDVPPAAAAAANQDQAEKAEGREREGGGESELPRGWSSLKNLYRYDEEEVEGECSS